MPHEETRESKDLAMRWAYWLLLLGLSLTLIEAKDYTKQSGVQLFIDEMVKKEDFDRTRLERLFRRVEYQKEALSVYVPSLRDHKPTKVIRRKQGRWDRYEEVFLKESKVKRGVAYLREHEKVFKRAYRTYGVQPEYIAAIIGIESHYGVNTGKYPVFDTLVTLAFEKNRRQRFFRSELKAFLLMTRREKVNPKRVNGSYAGAIGLGQFMPSTHMHFAVDFNRDGKRRLHSDGDAIGSIAYYLRRHGWRRTQPVAVRVSYPGKRYRGRKTGYRHRYTRRSLKHIYPKEPFDYHDKVHLIKLERLGYDELWYGTKNFYVITRYNHSSYYAMAVYQLAERLKKAYRKQYGKWMLDTKRGAV
jgi:membrane-bound lytic murein transglycosylase B